MRASLPLVLVLGVAVGWSAPVRASSNPSFDSAVAQCQAYMASVDYRNNFVTGGSSMYYSGMHCGVGPSNVGGCTSQTVCMMYTDSRNPSFRASTGAYGFTGSVPTGSPCASIAPANVYLVGKILAAYSIPQNTADPVSGGTVQCAMTVQPIGVPTMRSDGTWETYGSLTASGNLASGSGWTDGSGAAVNPQPPIPTLPATNVTAPPSVCTGSSCYNAGTNQYCGTAGGQQYCVSGATANSSAGGCASGNGAAVCAGQATIPAPPPAIIPDPGTQIQDSGKYTQASPATGAAYTVTVNAYALPGTKVTSGQQSGDAGPAPASSAGGSTNGTFAGGSDCQTPPVCTGDNVMCGAARTQWATTCQVHKDLTGTGAPSDYQSLSTKYTQADAWSAASASTGTVGDNANAGTYDNTGFGYGTTCPLTDLTVPLMAGSSFVIPMSKGCVIGPWLRGIILAFSLFAAARITAGSAF